MKKLFLVNLRLMSKHYVNSIMSYLSRILLTYFLTIITDKLYIIFFSVYFIVTLQSFFINSKIIYKSNSSSKKFINFLFVNIAFSFIEYFIFLKILSFFNSIVLSTAIVAIFTGFIRFLIYKKIIF